MNKKVHYIGLDVHKETIAVAIAPAGDTEVRHGTISGTLDALDKLIKKLQQPEVELRVVYEAGPCGYVIYRHLQKKGLHCQVVAPFLVPKKAFARVKTDRRDAQQLTRLYRAGELTAIYVPDEDDEAVRDLVRARHAAVVDQRKARQRLKGFLLRLGFRYTGKSSWNDAHQPYLASLSMPRPHPQIVFQEHIEASCQNRCILKPCRSSLRPNGFTAAALIRFNWEPGPGAAPAWLPLLSVESFLHSRLSAARPALQIAEHPFA